MRELFVLWGWLSFDRFLRKDRRSPSLVEVNQAISLAVLPGFNCHFGLRRPCFIPHLPSALLLVFKIIAFRAGCVIWFYPRIVCHELLGRKAIISSDTAEKATGAIAAVAIQAQTE
jgi:hypothetical protein